MDSEAYTGWEKDIVGMGWVLIQLMFLLMVMVLGIDSTNVFINGDGVGY